MGKTGQLKDKERGLSAVYKETGHNVCNVHTRSWYVWPNGGFLKSNTDFSGMKLMLTFQLAPLENAATKSATWSNETWAELWDAFPPRTNGRTVADLEPTRTHTKGLNLTREEHLGILWPNFNASSSTEKAITFQCGSNTAWQPGVHQITSQPSVCWRVRISNSGWNVAPMPPHERLLWKSPIVPAETQEGLAHTIITHQRLHLTEKYDH